MIKKNLFWIFVLSIQTAVFAQNPFRGKYNINSYALGLVSVRDQRVSPLFYEGPSFGYFLGRFRLDDRHESLFQWGMEVSRDRVEVLDEEHAQWNFRMAANYTYLWSIPSVSTERFYLKPGLALDVLGALRSNPSYFNSQFALHANYALLAVTKMDYLVIHRDDKNPLSIALTLNYGVLHMSSSRSKYSDVQANIFTGNEFHTRSGPRAKARFDVNWLNRKKSWFFQISYVYDVSSTGGNGPVDQQVRRIMFSFIPDYSLE